MISTETWLLYLGAVLLFMSTPGPSHLLMLSTSLANGFERSLATAAGDLTANALQIAAAGAGLAALVTASRYGFAVIKWAGVAYLVWLGIRQLLDSLRRDGAASAAPGASLRRLWLRGFVTSAANPKAVVFFAALFPQFIDPESPLTPQIVVLGATYIVVDGVFLASYAKAAAWLGQRWTQSRSVWIDRAAGLGLICAALMLGARESTER